jgi:hypothetical protein
MSVGRRQQTRGILSRRTQRLGLGVSSDGLRAVLVERGRVVWWREVNIDPSDARSGAMSTALDTLFVDLPSLRRPRPRLIIAVGPSLSQTRRLHGLPPLRDAVTLEAIVREGANRFFLGGSTTPLVSAVELDGESVWASAFDRTVVAELTSGTRRHGLRLRAVTPTMRLLVLARAAGKPEEVIAWRDGQIIARATYSHDRMVSLQCSIANECTTDEEPARTGGALAEIGSEAWRFADAYAAAIVGTTVPLSYVPPTEGGIGDSASGRSRAVAAAAFALALTVATVSPSLAARYAASRASRRLNELATVTRLAQLDERSLAVTTDTLRELASFAQHRRSFTLSLAAVAEAMPEGTNVLSLKADGDGVTLVAITPSSGELLTKLEATAGVVSPTILGPMIPESHQPSPSATLVPFSDASNTSARQRVTVRFRWSNARANGMRSGA